MIVRKTWEELLFDDLVEESNRLYKQTKEMIRVINKDLVSIKSEKNTGMII